MPEEEKGPLWEPIEPQDMTIEERWWRDANRPITSQDEDFY